MADEEKKDEDQVTDKISEEETKTTSDDKKEEAKSSSKGKYFALVLFGLIVIIMGFLLMSTTPKEETGPSNPELIAKALDFSAAAMNAAESSENLTIVRSSAKVTHTDNASLFLVSFPISGSEKYLAFDVVLDSDLGFVSLGLDGNTTSNIDNFISQFNDPNLFQLCAKKFNEKDVIPELISKWYNSTNRKTYMLDLPKTLDCGGNVVSYSLQIGDGFVTTTIGDSYYTHKFAGAIISKGVSIPERDISQGVIVYVTTTGPYELQYSYGLKKNNLKQFDKYASPDNLTKYSIQAVPSIVWNCKYVTVGTKASGELNGTFAQGSEKLMLTTFACIFNNGLPTDICSKIGITRNENGTISARIPSEYYLTMYQTGLDSCKPDDGTVKAEAFYEIDCPDCDNQRIVLSDVAKQLGDSMDLSYYCAGNKDTCNRLIDV